MNHAAHSPMGYVQFLEIIKEAIAPLMCVLCSTLLMKGIASYKRQNEKVPKFRYFFLFSATRLKNLYYLCQ